MELGRRLVSKEIYGGQHDSHDCVFIKIACVVALTMMKCVVRSDRIRKERILIESSATVWQHQGAVLNSNYFKVRTEMIVQNGLIYLTTRILEFSILSNLFFTLPPFPFRNDLLAILIPAGLVRFLPILLTLEVLVSRASTLTGQHVTGSPTASSSRCGPDGAAQGDRPLLLCTWPRRM